ncbi:hypothetical protein CAP35_12135 [Chitinophagaceae bacterium IBVUCB1]|nr:hypothetical protein CAP35_12135 [Chitinophagaceae bacterium IBVUCB1]
MKKQILLWVLCLLASINAIAQSGAIKVTVTSQSQTVGNAYVQILGQNIKTDKKTDAKGVATISNLLTGKYNITVSKAGYTTAKAYTTVEQGRTSLVNLVLQTASQNLQEQEIKTLEAASAERHKGKPRSTHKKDIIAYEDMAAPAAGMADVRSVYKMQAPVYYNPSTESYKKEKENDFMSVRANPLSTMSVDVDRASYSNIRRFINGGQMPPADAVRVEEMINYFDYNYPQPEGDKPLAIVTELTDCPWKPQHKLLHIGMQARTIPTHNLPPSNLVFLVDVSGSMSEHNKLPLVISSLKMLTSKLRAQDKISIVVYAGSAGLVLPATAGNQKRTIMNALDRLQAGGSTAGGAGIKLAYKVAMENYVRGGNNRVILATDGDFNVGISGDNEMETLITKEREKGIYLTCLGYGMGNYKDSKMEVLADKGNGNYAYIDSEQEAEKTLVREFGGTIFTLAKDVKAQIEFNPAYVQSYRLVGYENRLLNEEDFTDDKKDAGDMGSGHSVTIIYELIPAGVQSSDVRNVTPLKYQQRGAAYPSIINHNTGDELATIKFRYKKPNGNTSKEIVHTIANNTVKLQQADENARFATSVAMFGMLLKNSPHKGSSSYDKVLQLARNSMHHDAEGYRAEFVTLVKKVNKTDDVVASGGWYEEEE